MKRAAAAALATLPLLVACSSSSPQAAQPPPLSSLLKALNQTPTRASEAALTAAVHAYIDGLNKALRTGDISAATRASTADCTCRGQLRAIAAAYAKHVHFVGTQLVIVGPIVVTKHDPATARLRVSVRRPASVLVQSNGKRTALKAVPARPFTVAVVKRDGRWLVSSFAGSARHKATTTSTPKPTAKPTPSPKPSG